VHGDKTIGKRRVLAVLRGEVKGGRGKEAMRVFSVVFPG
jgi:hypothetical protein